MTDFAELWAKASIEATLGVDVVLWDADGRQGACDLRWSEDGRTVACEVKLVVDPAVREAMAQPADYTPQSDLTLSWTIRVNLGGKFKHVRAAAPDLLRLVESAGHREFHANTRGVRGALRRRLDELEISDAWGREPTTMHPPGFYVLPAGWGGGVPSVDALPRWASDLLAADGMEKLRSQLARQEGVDQRHAFLILGPENMAHIPLSSDNPGIPEAAPVLPDGIDGLWLATTQADTRLISWTPASGWRPGTTPTSG